MQEVDMEASYVPGTAWDLAVQRRDPTPCSPESLHYFGGIQSNLKTNNKEHHLQHDAK